eukprot:scaffold1122_cov377-Prasinococcus_capsulatus_cf.AAC.2
MGLPSASTRLGLAVVPRPASMAVEAAAPPEQAACARGGHRGRTGAGGGINLLPTSRAQEYYVALLRRCHHSYLEVDGYLLRAIMLETSRHTFDTAHGSFGNRMVYPGVAFQGPVPCLFVARASEGEERPYSLALRCDPLVDVQWMVLVPLHSM